MKAFESLGEHLQFTEKRQLLQLDVIEQAERLGCLKEMKQQQAVDRNLVRLTHAAYPISAFSPCAITIFVSRLYVIALGWVSTESTRPRRE
jgi:hypothetical protein